MAGLFLEPRRKGAVLIAAVLSHGQQLFLFFISVEEVCVLKMDETNIMSSATFLGLLYIKRKGVPELCNTGIATKRQDSGALDEQGRLHVVSTVGRLNLKGAHVLLRLEHLRIGHSATENNNIVHL